jgi:hypothetical protein
MREIYIRFLLLKDGVRYFFRKGKGKFLVFFSKFFGKLVVLTSGVLVFGLLAGFFSIGFIGSKYGAVELRDVLRLSDSKLVEEGSFLADEILDEKLSKWERAPFRYDSFNKLNWECYFPSSNSGPFSVGAKRQDGSLVSLAVMGVNRGEREFLEAKLSDCFNGKSLVVREKGYYARVLLGEGFLIIASGLGSGAEKLVNELVALGSDALQKRYREVCASVGSDVWCSDVSFVEVSRERWGGSGSDDATENEGVEVVEGGTVTVTDPEAVDVVPTPTPTPTPSENTEAVQGEGSETAVG